MAKITSLTVFICIAILTSAAAQTFNILDHGAKSFYLELNTETIQVTEKAVRYHSDQEQAVFQVRKVTSSMEIDGKSTESSWQTAESASFDFFYRAEKPGDEQNTEFKMLWDEENLYLLFECQDRYITAREKNRDGQPYFDDCAEIFLIPTEEKIDMHFGYEVNLYKTANDFIFLNDIYEDGNLVVKSFNPDFKVAVTIDGTLNDNSDTDNGWTMEMAIPLRNFHVKESITPTREGVKWAFMALRQDRNDAEGNRRSTSTIFPLSPENSNVHYPKSFGLLEFVGAPPGASATTIKNPDGLINLVVAPAEKFEGQIFLINDWDGGDKDNQNVGEELNRNAKIKKGVVILSDLPGRIPMKVTVKDLVTDASVLAKASKKGKIAIAMGAHSRHLLAWLTKLPASAYNYENITIVTHSNWNELDGRRGYDQNKKPGDPPLEDTHGVGLRRGLYLSLARIKDLGVTIWEIPRTDRGPGGWGGKIAKADGEARVKTLDVSDLGLVHYLKTGVVAATTEQRNQFVSGFLKKPATLDQLKRDLITRYWESNRGIPGEKEDYLKGGKYYKKK